MLIKKKKINHNKRSINPTSRPVIVSTRTSKSMNKNTCKMCAKNMIQKWDTRNFGNNKIKIVKLK